MNSKCISKREEKEFLLKILGNKRLMTTLLFRGSIHGWKCKDFHSRCDNKGRTITLFKVKDGDCIGGYNKAQWSSPWSGHYESDNTAMLFNLSCCRLFPNKQRGEEIFCDSRCGPCFGGSSSGELDTMYEPFNGDRKCSSRANKPSYCIPVDGNGTNMLTNKKDGDFTISELEVWQVTFIQ
jgi:hypothetical protein